MSFPNVYHFMKENYSNSSTCIKGIERERLALSYTISSLVSEYSSKWRKNENDCQRFNFLGCGTSRSFLWKHFNEHVSVLCLHVKRWMLNVFVLVLMD